MVQLLSDVRTYEGQYGSLAQALSHRSICVAVLKAAAAGEDVRHSQLSAAQEILPDPKVQLLHDVWSPDWCALRLT